jgi:hypothetical protein
MKIKRAYHYLYYKIYKSLDTPTNANFLLDWKAAIILDCLGICIGISLLIYYSVFSGNQLNLENNTKFLIFIYIAIIGIPNYFIFQHRDQWKEIVKEFDKLPKDKNKRGGIIVWSVIILIVANLIFAFCLLFDQAKKNHTGPYDPEYIEQQKIENSK